MTSQSLAQKFKRMMINAKVSRKGAVINVTEKGVCYQVEIIDGNLEVWRDGNIVHCYADEKVSDAAVKAAKLIVLDALGVYEAKEARGEFNEADLSWNTDDETVI